MSLLLFLLAFCFILFWLFFFGLICFLIFWVLRERERKLGWGRVGKDLEELREEKKHDQNIVLEKILS